jgi:hypothetical protein
MSNKRATPEEAVKEGIRTGAMHSHDSCILSYHDPELFFKSRIYRKIISL